MRTTFGLLPTTLALFLAGPCPAGANPVRPIPCDPPLDRPLKLSLTQDLWRADGTPARATVTRILRFTRDGDGLLVSAQIAALATDEHEAGATDRLTLAYGAPGGLPIVVRLDPAMAIVGVESLETHWADFRRRQAALAAAMTSSGAGKRAAAIGPMLDAMGPAERIGLLSAFLAPVLRHCGIAAPADAVADPQGMIRIGHETDSGPMHDSSSYVVDPRTGLLHALDRNLVSAAAPLRPLREHWTLAPDN